MSFGLLDLVFGADGFGGLRRIDANLLSINFPERGMIFDFFVETVEILKVGHIHLNCSDVGADLFDGCVQLGLIAAGDEDVRTFANAGVFNYAPLESITEEHYDGIFDSNVKGLVFTVQKALPLLPDGASIILNASIVGSKGLASNSIYSASKAAVRSFARTWTTDLKGRHIRVNVVSPGPIDTSALRELYSSTETGKQRMANISNIVPMGRLGTADEIAKAVVFLASDDSSYITGIELFVDGGTAQV